MGINIILNILKICYNKVMKKAKKLLDEYRFPGFRPLAVVKGKFSDNKARIIKLMRLQKKLSAVVVERFLKVSMIEKKSWLGIYLVATLESICQWKYDELTV